MTGEYRNTFTMKLSSMLVVGKKVGLSLALGFSILLLGCRSSVSRIGCGPLSNRGSFLRRYVVPFSDLAPVGFAPATCMNSAGKSLRTVLYNSADIDLRKSCDQICVSEIKVCLSLQEWV